MSERTKNMSFDTDYGIVGMSVNPAASEKDFDFDNSTAKDDGECGTTFDFASKSFVKAELKKKFDELAEKIGSLEKRLVPLESAAENRGLPTR